MMNYFPFLLIFTVLLIPFKSEAASTTVYTFDHQKLNNAIRQFTQGEISAQQFIDADVTYETKATTSQGQQVSRYTQKNTPLSKASFGKMAKGAMGGPVGIGIAAALVAADYLIDENTGEISKPNEIAQTAGFCSGSLQLIGGFSSTYAECLEYAKTLPSNPATVLYPRSIPTTAHPNKYRFESASGQIYRYWGVPSTVIATTLPRSDFDSSSSPASDDDVGDAIATYDGPGSSNLPSEVVGDSVRSGRWRDEWPEAVTDSTTINDTLENDIEGATNPNPDQSVTDSNTSTPRPIAPSVSEEWPTFCAWATVVCDFIDWVKAEPEFPENPEVPYVDLVEPDGFESGVGSGSCPADNIIVTQFGSVPISWQYPCQLATTFRPVVLFFAWIAALYIVVRVR